MKRSLIFCFFAGLCVLAVSDVGFAAPGYKLKKSETTVLKSGKKKYLCGLAGSKWSLVKKSGSKYVLDNGNKAGMKACRALLGKGKVTALSAIPSSKALAKANKRSAGDALRVLDVSGTPPTLSSIANGDVNPATLFWRAGIVDAMKGGSPTPQQCTEFFGDGTDGTSGQFSACYIAQNIGFSFETILQGGVSLCYLKKAPTQANFDGGAITLDSGTLPAGGVGGLMAAPDGSTSRVVKIQAVNVPLGNGQTASQNIFARIYSKSELQSGGDHYRADLWFCAPQAASAQALQNLRVKLTGEVQSQEIRVGEQGNSRNTLRAFLKSASGQLVFDTSKPRAATLFFESGSNGFKSDVEINRSDVIIAKTYDNFGGSERKAVSVAHFSGSNMADFRYDQGAYKFQESGGRSERTVNEYREPNYLNSESADLADGTDLLDLRDAIDFDDSFFSSMSGGPYEITGVSCDAAADAVISMDMSHTLMLNVQSECQGEQLSGMDFCTNNADIQAAMANSAVCFAGQ